MRARSTTHSTVRTYLSTRRHHASNSLPPSCFSLKYLFRSLFPPVPLPCSMQHARASWPRSSLLGSRHRRPEARGGVRMFSARLDPMLCLCAWLRGRSPPSDRALKRASQMSREQTTDVKRASQMPREQTTDLKRASQMSREIARCRERIQMPRERRAESARFHRVCAALRQRRPPAQIGRCICMHTHVTRTCVLRAGGP